MNAKKRLHVVFRGTVHGVGFRYTAERVAAGLELTGWVRNCEDGSVEAVCEGAEEAIVAFLGKISDVFGGYITDRDVEWSEATGEFHGFDIRF